MPPTNQVRQEGPRLDSDTSAASITTGGRVPPSSLFVAAAVGAIFLYLLLVRIVPCMPDAHPTHASEVLAWARPLGTDNIKQLQGTLHTPSASARFAAVMAAEFGLWGLMLLAASKLSVRRAAVGGFIAGTVLLATQLCSPATLSFDVYVYITQGRVLALRHLNPSATQATLVTNDPYLAVLGGSYIPSQYGPIWSLVEGGLATIGGDQIGLTFLLFRCASVLATLVTAVLVWRCAQYVRLKHAGVAVVFFLCNPLVVYEMGCGGHNDCWMVAPLMAGICFAVRGQLLWAAMFFAVAALVKAPAAVMGGLCLLVLLKCIPSWRERLVRAAMAVVVGLLVAGAAFGSARAWGSAGGERGGAALLSQLRDAVLGTDYLNSLHEVVFRLGRRVAGEDPQLADASMYFQGWWLKAQKPATLVQQPKADASVIGQVGVGTFLLVAAPQMLTDWVYVYDMASRRFGFVSTDGMEETAQPQDQSDPALADLSLPLGRRALPERVSVGIRLTTWLLFGAAFIWVARRTLSPADLPAACLLLGLLMYYLIASWFWPWYLLWTLPLAALLPRGTTRTITVHLSASALLLYAFSESSWAYPWRAVFVFGLPLLGTAVVSWIKHLLGVPDARKLARDRSA